MKLVAFLILTTTSLLIGCGSAPLPEVVKPEPQALLTPISQPTSPAGERAAGGESSPVTAPTAASIEISHNSPVATASSGETGLDDRRAVFPNTIIVYQQEGRFPDSPQQWTIYHTGRIVAGDGAEQQAPATQVKLLFDLVEEPNFWELDNRYELGDECLDCLRQTLTVYYEGKIKEIVIINEPPDLPENLRRALGKVNTLISK